MPGTTDTIKGRVVWTLLDVDRETEGLVWFTRLSQVITG